MNKTILVLSISLAFAFFSPNVNASKCYTCINIFPSSIENTFCNENVADEAHVINCEHIIDGFLPPNSLSSEKMNFDLNEIIKKEKTQQQERTVIGDLLSGCVTLNVKDFVIRTCSPKNICDLIKNATGEAYETLTGFTCDYCEGDHCNSSPPMYSLTISLFLTIILSAFVI